MMHKDRWQRSQIVVRFQRLLTVALVVTETSGPGFLEMSMNTVISLGGSGPGIKRV